MLLQKGNQRAACLVLDTLGFTDTGILREDVALGRKISLIPIEGVTDQEEMDIRGKK